MKYNITPYKDYAIITHDFGIYIYHNGSYICQTTTIDEAYEYINNM